MYEKTMILELFWKSSLFVLIGFLINRLFYGQQAAMRFQVWIVIFTAMLCIPLFGNIIPHWLTVESGVDIAFKSNQYAARPGEAQPSVAQPSVAQHGDDSQTEALPEPASSEDEFITNHSENIVLSKYLKFVTWSVFILINLYYLMGHLYMGWVLKNARPACKPEVLDKLEAIKDSLEIKTKVHLRFSQVVKGPLSYGVLKKYIVLPENHHWHEEELKYIFMHELTHIKRKDLPLQLFIQLVVAVCWFNPLVWMAYRRFKLDRELACDNHVVKNSDIVASDYAGFLLETARNFSRSSFLSQNALQFAKKTELEGRLLSILNQKKVADLGIYPMMLTGMMLIIVSGFTIQQKVPQAEEDLKLMSQDNKTYIIQHLKNVLNDDDLEVRIEALRAIDQIGGIPSLAEILGSSTKEEAALIKQAVHHVIGADKHMDIEQMITSGNKKVQKNIIRTLERLKDRETIRLITLALKDNDPEIREQAADALSAMKVPQAVPLLIETLNDADDDVRAEAADGLGDIKAEAAIPYLLQALNDPEDDVREEAAISLGQIGSDKALDHLIEKIHDEDRSVREAAVDALGVIKNQKALEPLLEALHDRDKEVRREAVASIRELFE